MVATALVVFVEKNTLLVEAPMVETAAAVAVLSLRRNQGSIRLLRFLIESNGGQSMESRAALITAKVDLPKMSPFVCLQVRLL
jgi:hypothetical protein